MDSAWTEKLLVSPMDSKKAQLYQAAGSGLKMSQKSKASLTG